MNYPDFEHHQEEHRYLLYQFRNFLNSTDIANIQIREFIDFAYNWFVTHITTSDKNIANFIKNNVFIASKDE